VAARFQLAGVAGADGCLNGKCDHCGKTAMACQKKKIRLMVSAASEQLGADYRAWLAGR
jgi:hypothetical protein